MAGNEGPTASIADTPRKPLLEYIPKSGNSSIIITSRSREVALKMVQHKDLIEVKPMEKSEALELLQKTLDQPDESQESRRLVEKLDFIPLAIVQAASYIRNRAPLSSVSQYLRHFQQSDRHVTKLLAKEAGHLYRDWEAKNSILVTWQISFDHVRHKKPSAADLLSLMSFFDRQGIPENLIRHQPTANYIPSPDFYSNSSDGDTFESDLDFEDDVAILRDYSLISIMGDSNSFTMHRLVQLTTRVWLQSHGKLDQWRDVFISILNHSFPRKEQYENWEICQSLFPHVRSAMSQRPESQQSLLQWATLLHRGARYAWQSGNLADLKEMALKAKNQRANLLGEEDNDTLESTSLLATAYSTEGQFEECERILVQVMNTRKRKLGDDHPDTLKAMGNLASTYSDQGMLKEAERLELQVLKVRKANLGEDHLDTLTSIGNLALSYLRQGRLEEAKRLLLQVMEARKKILGEDHPNTLAIIGNLALVHLQQNLCGEAEKLLEKVVQDLILKIGETHPTTLSSMNNLGVAYRSHQRFLDAEKLQLRLLNLSQARFADDHPFMLRSMVNLALIYSDQGRWDECEKVLTRVMEIHRAKLGDAHPKTLSSMENLAVAYKSLGQWEKAEKLEVQLMETKKSFFGEAHPTTLTSMANLAFTRKSTGRNTDALKLLQDCLAMEKQLLGPNPQILSISETLLEWETEWRNFDT